MIEREWTKAELDDRHRLPDGWHWTRTVFGWVAVNDGERATWGPPRSPEEAEIMLTVALVALGLDSREFIAASFDKQSDAMSEKSKIGGGYSDVLHARQAAGQAIEAQHCAIVVRRGTA